MDTAGPARAAPPRSRSAVADAAPRDAAPRPTPPAVVVVDERDDADDPPVDVDRWARLAGEVLRAEDIGEMEVSISFVDADTIAELKAEHLEGDGAPTDVLAFPIDEPVRSGAGSLPGDAPLVLGDVVICPSVAAAQAGEHAGSYDDEVALLLVHGLLHLLGHDHADDGDRQVMQARERELLDELHGPLAADPWSNDAAAPTPPSTARGDG